MGVLRRTLGHAVLSWEELATVLTEVEKVVNCRPITSCGSRPTLVVAFLSLSFHSTFCCHPEETSKKKKGNGTPLRNFNGEKDGCLL